MKFPSSLVKRLLRIDVETRLKGYKYFEIERDFFNKLGVPIDGDFKFGVLYLFLFVSLAVIQAIYIEMVFCKESMSVPFSLNLGISWKWTENSLFWLEYLSVLCLKVSIYQFCRKQLTKLANLLMHSQCTLSPQAGKRENWQFIDLSRLQFTFDESEFIPDYI